MLKLYGFKKVNSFARGYTRDLRILWALEEMQLPFELVGMDHPARDLSTEAFHKLNPFEQLPVVDDDGIVVTESGAILLYLAKKSGKLIPSDAAGEAQVTRWCFAALNSVEVPILALMTRGWFKEQGDDKYDEFLTGWAHRHLSNLESWLKDREYVATTTFTVADILMVHVLAGGIKDEKLLAPYSRLKAYRDRCLARPAWRRAIDRYLENVEPG